MSSKVPTVKQIAWVSIIPQILFMGLLFFIYFYLGFDDFIVIGAITYLIISYLLRSMVPRSHRSGMVLVKKQNFKDAIPLFEKSLTFFEKNSWIDKYRFIVLLSSSRITYKEMALVNIAFCYSQIGKGEEATRYYNKALEVFPDSAIAQTALNMMEAAKNEN